MPTIFQNALLSVCTCVCIGSPVIADQDTTALMEEIFEMVDVSGSTLKVREKRDSLRSTRWNNVTLTGKDESFEAKLAWIEVNKNLLGGYSVTMAEDVLISGDAPEMDMKVKGKIATQDLAIKVDGNSGQRDYETSFAGMNVTLYGGDALDMTMSIGAGSSRSIKSGDVISGEFDYESIDIQYDVATQGSSVKSSTKMTGYVGTYRMPLLAAMMDGGYQMLFEPNSNFAIDYTLDSFATNTTAPTMPGFGSISMIGGKSSAKIGVRDGVAAMSGEQDDVEYTVSMPASGLPQMKVRVAQATSVVGVPVDNVDVAKPAQIQLDLKGLKLDPAVWAMFDPTGVLPQDEADLKIDIAGNVKWSQKISGMVENSNAMIMPIMLEDAKVTALNLSALGATLETTGSFNIDNSTFPPAPSGTADVSIKGVNGVMDKLSEAGLLPLQNAMVAKGMMTLFFKQGGEGSDHLTSQIVVSPNGSITANGFPLK